MQNYLLRVISSFAGWIVWTVAFVWAYFLTLILLPNSDFNPTASLTIIFLVFISSSLNNIVSNILISLSDTQKYTKMRASIWQIFTLNIFLFAISIPFYFIFNSIQLVAISYIVISSFASFLVLEIYARKGNFILTWLYWATVSLFLVSISFFQIFSSLGDFTFVFFFIMPIVNLMFSVCILCAEFVASEAYKTYWINFLDINSSDGW